MKCSKCHTKNYVKAGFMNGTQRYRCKTCGRCFTVERKSTQKSDEVKRMAIHMYLEGLGFRAIGRILNISYGTVYKWVKKLGEENMLTPNKNPIEVVELDEIHSYITSKKITCGHGLLLIDTQNASSVLFVAKETPTLSKDFTTS